MKEKFSQKMNNNYQGSISEAQVISKSTHLHKAKEIKEKYK